MAKRDQTKAELRESAGRGGSVPPPSGAPRDLAWLYRLLVDSVRDYAIFALDATGHILTWNKGAEQLKGYTADEIIGRHFSIFYPPDALAARKPERELEEATANGRVEDEGWRLRKDGTRFWANVIITALRDPAGELVGFAKVTRDLTDRQRAQESLRESEERFRLLVQSVKDYGIFMLDPLGRIISWNDGAGRIEGYSAEEILGRHFSVFYPAEDIAAGKPARELREAIRDGRFEDEGWRVHKDGSLFWANVIITPLYNPEKDLIGFAKVTRDLTERRAAQQREVAAARRMAETEAANRAKSEFLTAMSHELRTPLNAIGGYVDLLLAGVRGPMSEQQIEDLERIRLSQRHLLGIITDLLNFSRIEAGRITYDIAPVPLAEVISAVLPMVEPQAQSKELALQAEWDPAAVARADRGKVEQIALNLLNNAIKFTPPGGHISVWCSNEPGRAVLHVRDTGVGMPAEKLDAIFEPFVQLDRTLTTAHEGTGLGLSISRDLARAMNGDLTVESLPGLGSTFHLTLPTL